MQKLHNTLSRGWSSFQRRSRVGKLILGGLILVSLCCLCALPLALLPGQDEAGPQDVAQGMATQTLTVVQTELPTPTASPISTAAPTTTAPLPLPSPTPTLARELALVTRVIDGDTIEVLINNETFRLRYIGMDTPEHADPFAAEATAANRQLVEGKIVELEQDVS